MNTLMTLLGPLYESAFALGGAAVTWAELAGFVLALATVCLNIRVNPWGWPLAIVSSLLYFGLFWQSRLYGDASLQIFFAVLALWGWRQWVRRTAPGGAALAVRHLSARACWITLAVLVVACPATGLFLKAYTDTDVPFWDAVPTAASVVGQWLLGRKYVENWPLWIFVNVVSIALFAYKGLWLTVLLYALFVAMAAAGWRTWHRLARDEALR